MHLLPLEPAIGGLVAELDPAEAHIAGLSDVVPRVLSFSTFPLTLISLSDTFLQLTPCGPWELVLLLG